MTVSADEAQENADAYGSSARRIEADIAHLSQSAFTSSSSAICRYGFTAEFMRTLDWFAEQFRALDFDVRYDAVGNLVARNVPAGERVFALGSHCDSNRNGGRYDGTLGVVAALEVARLNALTDRVIPLQVVAFAEEESSGFGELLLGSRAATGLVTEADLKERIRSLDDGRSFWEHAEDAGLEPGKLAQAPEMFDGVVGWIEIHIEQARVLEGSGLRVGIVDGISGWTHSDYVAEGQADHAGGTPMGERRDAALAAAHFMIALDEAARAAETPTVGTVGSIELAPGLRNVIAGQARWTSDVRGLSDACVASSIDQAMHSAEAYAKRVGVGFARTHHHVVPAVPLDRRLVEVLCAAAADLGEPTTVMSSGAAHDTMLVASKVPSGMIFVPCRGGISHSPEEFAEPKHAAVAAAIALRAIDTLMDSE